MKDFLFVNDINQLRGKFNSFDSPLREYWDALKDDANNGHSFYPAFCYLITGELHYAELTKNAILNRIEYCKKMDSDPEFQNHLWCQSAHTMRFAIFYDWIYDSGIISQEEHIYIQNGLIDYTFKHPYQSIQARVIIISENQQLAMVLSCIITGYVCGVKRGNNILAQEIINDALKKVSDIIGLIPSDGYSGEGSVHVGHAYMPGISFLCAILEWISGEDYLNKEFAPNNTAMRKVFEFYNLMSAPSGLMIPIDEKHTEYRAKFPYAYFATKTGNNSGLDLIAEQNLWNIDVDVLWANDDKAWTLFWWPANKKTFQKVDWKSWALHDVAGCLVDSNAKNHLIQMWDNCHFPPVRQEAKPNSLLLESYGIPLIMDNGVGCSELEFDRTMDINRDGGWTNNWGYGAIGGHTCIVIDDEAEYTPREILKKDNGRCHGILEEFIDNSRIKLISSDATKFYSERYDIESIVRTTFILDDTYIIIKDTIKANSEHKFTWRGYLRGGSSHATSKEFTVTNPQYTGCTLIPFESEFDSVNFLADYPQNIPPGSFQLNYNKRGKEVCFLTVLLPFDKKDVIEVFNNTWLSNIENKDKGRQLEWNKPFYNDSTWKSVDITQPWLYNIGTESTIWYRKEFFIDVKYRTEKLYINLAKLPPDISVYFNGQVLFLPDRRGERLPLVLRLPVNMVRFGKKNLIVLRVKSKKGIGFSGPTSFGIIKKDVPKLKVSSSQEFVLNIEQNDKKLFFLYDNPKSKSLKIGTHLTSAKYALISEENIIEINKDMLKLNNKSSKNTNKFNTVFTIENVTKRVEQAKESLKSENFRERINGCLILADHKCAMSANLLLKSLNDSSWEVGISAIRGLAKRREKEAVLPLLNLLKEENRNISCKESQSKLWRVKMWIAIALGEIGDKTAVSALANLLTGNDFYTVRAMSAKALVKINVDILPEKLLTIPEEENESNTLFWWRKLLKNY